VGGGGASKEKGICRNDDEVALMVQ